MKNYPMDSKEATQELVTIRDFIRWAVSHFNQANLVFGHGTDNAWDEAVHLVLSSLRLAPGSDQNVLEAKLTHTERKQIVINIERRVKERIPVPYLIQEAWFAGLNFYVDERVIIPRSPIAELIEEEFSPWVESENVHHILDLCTGSGCIAISTALAIPHAQIDAVDINQDALDVAAINVKKFAVQENVRLIQSDLFEKLEDKKYDIIVTNPPYVRTEEYHFLPKEFHHEPKLALEAGEDGLQVVGRILQSAQNHLTPKGILIVEVGLLQENLEAKYPDVPFTWLQFERGGEGVFLLTAEELKEFNYQLKQKRNS
ncbi:MAG TPA: 50S ribosomal protein L3 N(5)-glutamine methyltransferase [Gammaproteobacteria bacterium]|nr:50S ribosomal protein L3 N(5)-glutamine methyltransferase [Gammaproteobacteria bacterium]